MQIRFIGTVARLLQLWLRLHLSQKAPLQRFDVLILISQCTLRHFTYYSLHVKILGRVKQICVVSVKIRKPVSPVSRKIFSLNSEKRLTNIEVIEALPQQISSLSNKD